MLEEAGLEFEPEAVLMLEHNSHGTWIRITFAGKDHQIVKALSNCESIRLF